MNLCLRYFVGGKREFLGLCVHLSVGLHFTSDHRFTFCDLLGNGIFSRRIDLVFRIFATVVPPWVAPSLYEVGENLGASARVRG